MVLYSQTYMAKIKMENKIKTVLGKPNVRVLDFE
tara:strand:- start:6059 stop:6160 length:102 start_codon:yes stop_codon:yes gene_type:complete